MKWNRIQFTEQFLNWLNGFIMWRLFDVLSWRKIPALSYSRFPCRLANKLKYQRLFLQQSNSQEIVYSFHASLIADDDHGYINERRRHERGGAGRRLVLPHITSPGAWVWRSCRSALLPGNQCSILHVHRWCCWNPFGRYFTLFSQNL